MTPLKHLLGPVADERAIRRGWDAIEERLDARLHDGRRARARGWSIKLGAGAGAIAAAAVAVVLVLRSGGAPPAGPLALRGGSALPLDLRSDVRLSDGSEIAITGGRLEVVDNSDRAVHLVMPAGTARFAIEPGGPRRWTIDGGLAQVEVVGTIFTVVRAPDAMTVSVERGVVLVRGDHVPGRVRRLLAGEQVKVLAADVAPPAPPAASAAERAAPAQVAAAPERPAPSAPAGGSPSKPGRRAAADRAATGESARTSREPASAAAVPAVPVPSPGGAPAAMTVDEALAKADLLRRRGELAAAVAVLAQIDPKSAGSQVGIAWFTRARLLIELDRSAEAAADLERAIAAGLPSALEARARARLAELTKSRAGAGGDSR